MRLLETAKLRAVPHAPASARSLTVVQPGEDHVLQYSLSLHTACLPLTKAFALLANPSKYAEPITLRRPLQS